MTAVIQHYMTPAEAMRQLGMSQDELDAAIADGRLRTFATLSPGNTAPARSQGQLLVDDVHALLIARAQARQAAAAPPNYLPVAEAAARLATSEDGVRKLVKAGRLRTLGQLTARGDAPTYMHGFVLESDVEAVRAGTATAGDRDG